MAQDPRRGGGRAAEPPDLTADSTADAWREMAKDPRRRGGFDSASGSAGRAAGASALCHIAAVTPPLPLAGRPFALENAVDVVVMKLAIELMMRAQHRIACQAKAFEQSHRSHIEGPSLTVKLVEIHLVKEEIEGGRQHSLADSLPALRRNDSVSELGRTVPRIEIE